MGGTDYGNKDVPCRKSQVLPDRHSDLDSDKLLIGTGPAIDTVSIQGNSGKGPKNVTDWTNRAQVLQTEAGLEIGKDCKQGHRLETHAEETGSADRDRPSFANGNCFLQTAVSQTRTETSSVDRVRLCVQGNFGITAYLRHNGRGTDWLKRPRF